MVSPASTTKTNMKVNESEILTLMAALGCYRHYMTEKGLMTTEDVNKVAPAEPGMAQRLGANELDPLFAKISVENLEEIAADMRSELMEAVTESNAMATGEENRDGNTQI